ncbi:MAG TPA: hypothetical protein VF608_02790, partial [Thermoanaerobaculia bacterium]
TVPVSHEIRSVATRHFSADVFLDPRMIEHPDFVWDDALESLAKARPRDFFQRSRRTGLRRPWDADATAELLRLVPPMTVLSSPGALADSSAADALLPFSLALIDALVEPVFVFVAERKLAPRDVDVVLIVPPHAGRAVRGGLQKLVRKRGFGGPLILNREVAAALSLIESESRECVIIDSTDDDLHVHRITFSGVPERRVRTVHSSSKRGLGRSHWVSNITAALGVTRSAAFDRSLLSMLTGSPDSLQSPVTNAEIRAALDERWVNEYRAAWIERLREQYEEIGAGVDATTLLIGEIFALDAMRDVFGGRSQSGTLDLPARGVATAMHWLHASPTQTLCLSSAGSLSINTLRGNAVTLLDSSQLPAPGESCLVRREFRFAGEPMGGAAFLVHLLWGTNASPEGNAALTAMPIRRRGEEDLQVVLRLNRSANGAVLNGSAAMSAGHAAVTARFSHEVEVRR